MGAGSGMGVSVGVTVGAAVAVGGVVAGGTVAVGGVVANSATGGVVDSSVSSVPVVDVQAETPNASRSVTRSRSTGRVDEYDRADLRADMLIPGNNTGISRDGTARHSASPDRGGYLGP